jgi:RNA polymerase sigma factor (sigma-70 family)
LLRQLAIASPEARSALYSISCPSRKSYPRVAMMQSGQEPRAEVLRHSLARLSPEHREIIDLVYFHGKSVKEVAEIIGIATATVKTRMFYARKKLADFVAAA